MALNRSRRPPPSAPRIASSGGHTCLPLPRTQQLLGVTRQCLVVDLADSLECRHDYQCALERSPFALSSSPLLLSASAAKTVASPPSATISLRSAWAVS